SPSLLGESWVTKNDAATGSSRNGRGAAHGEAAQTGRRTRPYYRDSFTYLISQTLTGLLVSEWAIGPGAQLTRLDEAGLRPTEAITPRRRFPLASPNRRHPGISCHRTSPAPRRLTECCRPHCRSLSSHLKGERRSRA